MSTLHKNSDVRTIALGIKVRRAAAALPQTATTNYFQVSGGRIKLVQLIGEYTVTAAVTANTLVASYQSDAAGSAALPLSIASAAQASALKGVHLWLPASAASALSSDVGAPVGGGGAIPLVNYIVATGKVKIQATGSNATARVQWDLYYVPLDLGAKVVAL